MKRLLSLILAGVASATSFAQDLTGLKPYDLKVEGRPKVAVVLAGGGAKGIAHVTALETIERAGIPIDLVVGTSMGSIIGGAYCSGYSPDSMKTIIGGTDWVKMIAENPDYGTNTLSAKKDDENYMLRFAIDPGRITSGVGLGGVISGQNVMRFFQQLFNSVPDSIGFDDLPVPFACVGTEAIEGSCKVFTAGNLPSCIRASMAIPSVFTPMTIDSVTYVDGGVVDNFAVDVARQLGADIVIGVDLVTKQDNKALTNSAIDVLMHCLDFYSQERYRRNVKDADVYIPIDVTGYNAASFGAAALDTLMRRGSYYSMLKKPALDSLAARLQLQEPPLRVRLGDYHFANTRAGTTSWLYDPEEEAHRSLAKVNGGFLNSSINVGWRFDTEELASLQFKDNVVLSQHHASIAKLEGRIGEKIVGKLDFSTKTFGTQRVGLYYKFIKDDFNVYVEGKKLGAADMRQHKVNLYLTQEWHSVTYTFGANYNLFLFDDILTNMPGSTVAEDQKEHYFSYFLQSEYNSLNTQYFPTSGQYLEVNADLVTDNLYNYEDNVPVPIFAVNWMKVLGISSRWALMPHLAGRVIIGHKAPQAVSNFVGGVFDGQHYLQQLTLAGVSRANYVSENGIGIAGITLQHNPFKNQYIQLKGDVITMANDWKDVVKSESLYWGAQASYNVRTPLGPLSAIFYYSNYTDDIAFLINVGYHF